MFERVREVAVQSVLAVLRARNLVQAQPYSLLSGPEKRAEIKKWQSITGHRLFVETGTFLGETTVAMASVFEHCWTVEIDSSLYEQARAALAGRPNVTILHGDSETVMPLILREIAAPAIFWLDGHYSRGKTGRGKADTPILTELARIFEHPVTEHVILIDDARTFLGVNGYPTIRRLHQYVEDNSRYRMRIANDIIRLYNEAI